MGPALPLDGSGALDYSEDFFSNAAFLTVSGQLNAEMYACALGRVYTFGPTFRAENSNTSRHLAEFWMVEPEMAFANLDEDISLAEAYVKHCLRFVLESCKEDLGLFERFYEKGLVSKLQVMHRCPLPTTQFWIPFCRDLFSVGSNDHQQQGLPGAAVAASTVPAHFSCPLWVCCFNNLMAQHFATNWFS